MADEIGFDAVSPRDISPEGELLSAIQAARPHVLERVIVIPGSGSEVLVGGCGLGAAGAGEEPRERVGDLEVGALDGLQRNACLLAQAHLQTVVDGPAHRIDDCHLAEARVLAGKAAPVSGVRPKAPAGNPLR